MSNCKHKVPCGCKDVGLTTANSCETGTPACPTPEQCAETFCTHCILYCGDTIVDTGIMQGERMDVILQMLTLFLTNPGCITPSVDGAITNVITPYNNAGLGYTAVSSFPNTPLVGGTGTGAIALVETGAAGEIINVVITTPGSGYTEGDILTPSTTNPGVPTVYAALEISVAVCKSVLGLMSTAITSTTINVAWLTEISAVTYQVEYKLATSSTWTLNPPVAQSATPTDFICSLTPNTAYHIRVRSFCANGDCVSVTILVTTKP